jgi:ATP-binding protein involved in chromosome partitioning
LHHPTRTPDQRPPRIDLAAAHRHLDPQNLPRNPIVLTKDAVLAALAPVAGPDGRTPLPRSPALSDVVVQGDKVYLSIAIDPARSMELEPMRAAAEKAVLALRGVGGAVVTLTSERGAQPPVSAPGQRTTGARTQIELPAVKHIIAVASGKGGVGKSTVTANLALGFAANGLKVGVMDADVFGPSQPTLFGLAGQKPAQEGGKLVPLTSYGVKVMSIGFLVDPEAAMIWRGPMVMSAVQQLLRDVAWGELDVLLIDMPPGTGDTQLTIAQSIRVAGAVIVSTPQDLALIDARRGIAMFGKTQIPVLGVIENMSYFICDAGKRYDIFGHGGAKAEAEKLGVPFLGDIPLVMAIRKGADEGVPIVAAEPGGPQAMAFIGIAQTLWSGLDRAPERRAPSITFA